MVKSYYYISQFSKDKGQYSIASVLRTDKGYFDFVEAAMFTAQDYGVRFQNVVVVFWKEIPSVMFDKFINIYIDKNHEKKI